MENQMKKNDKIINILLIVIMILVVLGCAVGYLYFAKAKPVEEDNNKETLFTLKNYPKIDGSISTLPLAEAFKSAFTGTDIENVDVTHSKTHNAYLNLINKNVDLIEEVNKLYWIDKRDNFFDKEKYAGEGNIGHMVEQSMIYKDIIFNNNNSEEKKIEITSNS